MSSGDFLEKLLDGVAVEWKALGSVTAIKTGQSVNKQMISANPGDYPVINSGREPLGYINEWNTDNDPMGITTRGAGVGSITWQEGKYFRGNLNYSVTINSDQKISTRYLYHLLLEMQSDIQALCTFDGIPALNSGNLKELKIPIPCPGNPKKSLEIQAEIVRILDTFTELNSELAAELSTELAARKKQYSYYLEQLLSFEGGEVEWKTLPEVSLDFGRGKSKHRPRNDVRLYGGNIPFIQTGDIRGAARIITSYDQTYSELGLKQSKLWPEGTLCITIAANIAETSILGFDACFPDSVIGFVANPSLTSSAYVEFILQVTKAKLEEKGKERSSAQSNINLGTFEQLKLPFPSLVEQARIVAFLDKFDTLTNSISEGLLREIELRQKQYDYYRGLLLSFPEPEPEEEVA